VRCTPILLMFLLVGPAAADDSLIIAVASNFTRTASELAERFRADTGTEVRVSSGSTGTLYAHIVNGAPYDVFLAADSERPKLLEASGHAAPGTRFTYAQGALALWSLKAPDCPGVLRDDDAGYVALANPLTAPYGAAAKEFLEGAGYWGAVSKRAVYGENAMQALQFAATGNATIVLVARSLLTISSLPRASCTWNVPTEAHAPILQQAVVVASTSNVDAARRFAAFLRSDAAREVIENHGYELPE
jgi:molybdate transport system substrate-binding protein